MLEEFVMVATRAACYLRNRNYEIFAKEDANVTLQFLQHGVGQPFRVPRRPDFEPPVSSATPSALHPLER